MPDLLTNMQVGSPQYFNPAVGTGTMDVFQPNLFPSSTSGTTTGGIGLGFLNQASPVLQRLANYTTPQADNPQALPTDMSSLIRMAAPQALQSTMNNLAGRGMINSSVGSDALSKTLTNLGANAMTLGNQNAATNQATTLQTNLANLGSQLQTPNVLNTLLGNIGGLGSTAGGLGQFSYSANPLAPYELLNQFVLNY